MALTKPYNFTSGIVYAAYVNANFDTLYDAIGTQEFTYQYYVTNDETITASLDALDQQVKANADAIGVSASLSLPEQSSLPTTVSNTPKILSMEGASTSESLPILARENALGSITMLVGNGSHKQWVYRNDATPMWVIDATITDSVIALKGGSRSYNVDGGNPDSVASWVISGSSLSGRTDTADGDQQSEGAAAGTASEFVHTHGVSGVSVSFTGAWRPKAAVGTMQYPDTN